MRAVVSVKQQMLTFSTKKVLLIHQNCIFEWDSRRLWMSRLTISQNPVIPSLGFIGISRALDPMCALLWTSICFSFSSSLRNSTSFNALHSFYCNILFRIKNNFYFIYNPILWWEILVNQLLWHFCYHCYWFILFNKTFVNFVINFRIKFYSHKT